MGSKLKLKPEKTPRIHQGRIWHDLYSDGISVSGDDRGNVVIMDGGRVVCKIPADDPALKIEGGKL